MNRIDAIELEIKDLNLRLRALEDVRISGGSISVKDILYLNNRLNDLTNQLNFIKNNIEILDVEEDRTIGVKQDTNGGIIDKISDNIEGYTPIKPTINQVNPVHKAKISETNIGKYIVGILASILVLLGLGVFVGSLWGQIPDIVKLLILLTIGAIISVVGWNRLIKIGRDNGFWTSITGLGTSIIYMSLILGSMTWEVYDFTICGILVLVWFFLNYRLAKEINSLVFYIITYIGGIVTIFLYCGHIYDSDQNSFVTYALLSLVTLIIFLFGEYNIIKNNNKKLVIINSIFGIIYFIFLSIVIGDYKENTLVLSITSFIIPVVILIDTQRFQLKNTIIHSILNNLISMAMILALVNIFNLDELDLFSQKQGLYVAICYIVTIAAISLFNKGYLNIILGTSPIVIALIGVISELVIFEGAALLPLLASLVLICIYTYTEKFENVKEFKVIPYISYGISIGLYLLDVDSCSDTMQILTYVIIVAITIIRYIAIYINKSDKCRNIKMTLHLIVVSFLALPVY